MSWEDIAANPKFQDLPPERQSELKQKFFVERMAPNIPAEKLEDIRSRFMAPKPEPASPLDSAAKQYTKAAGKLIASASMMAKYGAPEQKLPSLNLAPLTTSPDIKVSPGVSVSTDMQKAEELDARQSLIDFHQSTKENLSKAAHEAALQFDIHPKDYEGIHNPTIEALGITKPLRIYQTLIDRSLPEVAALKPWADIKDKPLADRIEIIKSRNKDTSKFQASAIAPEETGKKKYPKFDLALRSVIGDLPERAASGARTEIPGLSKIAELQARGGANAEMVAQEVARAGYPRLAVAAGVAAGFPTTLSQVAVPVPGTVGDVEQLAAIVAAGDMIPPALLENVARTNPDAGLRAILADIGPRGNALNPMNIVKGVREGVAEFRAPNTARLGKPRAEWNAIDHAYQHIHNQTNAALEGVQEAMGASPETMKAATAAFDRAGTEDLFRQLAGLKAAGGLAPMRMAGRDNPLSRPQPLRIIGPAEAEGVAPRPITTDPVGLAANKVGAGVAGPESVAVNDKFPHLYDVVAHGAAVPNGVSGQFESVIAALARAGVKEGPIFNMVKEAVATGKGYIAMEKLDAALRESALTEQGAHPETLQRHAADAHAATNNPGGAITEHFMRVEAEKAAVLARARATQEVWDEAHRAMKEAEETAPAATDAERAKYGLGPVRTVKLYRAMTAEEYAEFQKTGIVKAGPGARVTENKSTADFYATQRGGGARVVEFDASSEDLQDAGVKGENAYQVTRDIDTNTKVAPALPGRAEALAHAEEAGVSIERAAELHRDEALKEQESGTLDPAIAQEYIDAGDDSFDPAALEDATYPFPNMAKHPAEMTWEEFSAEYPGMDKATHQAIVEDAAWEAEKVQREERKEVLRTNDIKAQPAHDILRKNPISQAAIKKLRLHGEFKDFKGITTKKGGISVDTGGMGNDRGAVRLLIDAGLLPEGASVNDMLDLLDREARKGTKDDAESAMVRDEPVKGLDGIVPAIKTANGEIIRGDVGDHHQDIVDRVKDPKAKAEAQKAKDDEIPGAGFIDNGKFITREDAQAKYGFSHSEELNEMRASGGGSLVRDQGFSDDAQGFLFDDQGRTNPAAIDANPAPRPKPKAFAAQGGLPLTESPTADRKPLIENPSDRMTPTTKTDKEVSDVGQELWYNRRNLIGKGLNWEDIRGLNSTLKALEVQKTKVWPRPDYESLIEGGMQPFTAHLVKQVYDTISTKPSVSGTPTDAQMESYVHEVARVKEAVFAWAKDAGAQKEMLAKMAAQAQARLQRGSVPISMLAVSGSEGLLDRVYPKDPNTGARWGRQNMEQNDRIALIGGRKVADALSMDVEHAVEALKAVDKGWPTPQEAWSKRFDIKEYPKGTENYSNGVKQPPLEKPQFFVVNKGGGFWKRGNIMSKPFDTREQATAAAKDMASKKGSVDQKRPEVENRSRKGPPVRPAGLNVQPKDLMEQFGFKGVNYGNYTNDAERQVFTNNAYDALMDLAASLKLPPKALSLNGVLGLAYGAQGRGGKFSAAAHFVPGVNEINLTKDAGAGTIAHEWFHALDHYFATQAGDKFSKSSAPYLTAWARTESSMPVLRPEIRKAFSDIMDAMTQRAETPVEYAARHEKAVAQAVKYLDSWLASLRRHVEGEKTADAALSTDRQAAIRANELNQFDLLADALRAGKNGSGTEKIGTGMASYVSSTVGELRRLYKDVVGRMPDPDSIKSLNSTADWVKSLRDVKKTQERLAASMSDTSFLKEAKGLDAAKGGKQYWTTNWELGARTFESYMIDRLAQEAMRNDYLASPQPGPEAFKEQGGDWYPRGVERESINKAFDTLVNSLKTRETERGMMIYDRLPDEEAKAYGPGVDVDRVMKEVQLDLDFGGNTGIGKALAKDGKIDYRGVEINDIQDVAEVIASRRHPKLEHNNFVLLRKGKVVSHMVFTSGRPNAVLITASDLEELNVQMEKTGADALYTGHNHPSGNPTPSLDDKSVNAKLRGKFQEKYKGMLTTDGKDFFHTNPEGHASRMGFRTAPEQFPIPQGPTFTGASSSEEVVAYASKDAMFGKKHTLVLQDTRARVIAIEHFDVDANIPASAKGAIVRHSASRAILISPKTQSSKLSPMPLEVRDVVSIDKDGKASGYQAYQQGESAYGPIQSMRVSEGESLPRYMSRQGMDADDFSKAIAKAKIIPGSPVTAGIRFEGIAKGTKGKVLGVGQKTQTLMVQFEGEMVPRQVRAEYLVETNRKPAAKVAIEAAKRAEKVSGQPSLSIKKIIQEGQAGLSQEDKIQISELELLKQKFQNQGKGSAIGAREATKTIRAQMDVKIQEFRDKVAKLKLDVNLTKKESDYNARWMEAEKNSLRQQAIEYVNNVLPIGARGKFINRVAKADTTKKLSMLIADVDNEVANLHVKNLLSQINIIADRILDSPRVDVLSKKALRDYMQDVQLKGRSSQTYTRLRNILDDISRREAVGEDVEIPKALNLELDTLGRKPLKDMGEEEIEGVFMRLKYLEEIGRLKVKTREAIYELEKENMASEIYADLTPLKYIEKHRAPELADLSAAKEAKNKMIAKANGLENAYMDLMPPAIIWDSASKVGHYNGALIKHMDHGVGGDYRKNIDGYEPITTETQKIIDEEKLTGEDIRRAYAYALLQQPDGGKYLEAMGLSPEYIKGLNTLSTGQKKWYDSWRSYFDKALPRIADSLRFNDNLEIGKIPNYFPVYHNPEAAVDTGEDFSKMVANWHEGFRKNVAFKNILHRSGGMRDILMDGQKIAENYARAVEYKIAMSRRLRMLGEIVNSPKFLENGGDRLTRYSKNFVTMMARRGSPRSSDMIPWMDEMRRDLSTFWIVGSPSTALVHLTLLPYAAAVSGGGVIFGALSEVLAADLRKDPSIEEFWRKNNPIYRQGHGNDPVFIDAQSITDLKSGKLWKFATTPSSLRYIVRKATLAALHGNYKVALKKRGLEFDANNPNTDSINDAITLTNRAIASPELPYMFLAYNFGEAFLGRLSENRLATQFQNFRIDRWSTISHDLKNAIKEKRVADATAFVFWQSAATAAEVGIRNGVSSLIAAALAGVGGVLGIEAMQQDRDVDDDWKKKFMSEFYTRMLSLPPFASDIINVGLYHQPPTTVLQIGMDVIEKGFAAHKSYMYGDNRAALIHMTQSLLDLSALELPIPGGSVIEKVMNAIAQDGSVRYPYREEREMMNARYGNNKLESDKLERRVLLNHNYARFEKLNHNYKMAVREGRAPDAAQILNSMKNIAHEAKPK